MSFLLRNRKTRLPEHSNDHTTHTHSSHKSPRPLFRRRQRSAIGASLAFLTAYYCQKWVHQTAFARVVAEMVVAFIGLTALTLFILAHHRGGGHARLMNQTQEEIILICIFGLFWFAFLLGIREWNERNNAQPTSTWGTPPPPPQRMQSPPVGGCPRGNWMCVIEEVSSGRF